MITNVDLTLVAPGAYVVAPNFLEDPEATDTRGMKILRMEDHNGRPAFVARMNAREGDAPATMAEREVWRYVSQVTRIVRAPR